MWRKDDQQNEKEEQARFGLPWIFQGPSQRMRALEGHSDRLLHARVDEGDQVVDEEIDDEIAAGDDQEADLNQRIVAVQQGLHQQQGGAARFRVESTVDSMTVADTPAGSKIRQVTPVPLSLLLLLLAAADSCWGGRGATGSGAWSWGTRA